MTAWISRIDCTIIIDYVRCCSKVDILYINEFLMTTRRVVITHSARLWPRMRSSDLVTDEFGLLSKVGESPAGTRVFRV